VRGVQAHYVLCEGGACAALDGPVHMQGDGRDAERRQLAWDPETEAVAEVAGRAGSLLDGLEVTLQPLGGGGGARRAEAFGGTGGLPFRCPMPAGHTLVALHGAVGGHIHRLGFFAGPMPAAVPATAPAPAPAPAAGEASAPSERPAARADGRVAPERPAARAEALSGQEEAQLRLQQLVR